MGARALLLLVLLALPAFAQYEVLRAQIDGRPVRAWLATAPRLGAVQLEVEGAVKPLSVTCDMPAMPRMAARTFPFKGPTATLEFTMKGLWRLDFRFEGERHLAARLIVQGGGVGSQGTVSSLSGEACGPGVPAGAAVRVQVLAGKLHVGESRVRIALPPGPAPAEVPVSVQMPAMPMAAPLRTASRQPDGSYLATLPLSMPGVWHVWVDVEGRALGPVVLVVDEPAPPSPSLLLLGLALVLAWPLRRHLPALLVVVAALVAGLVLERYRPAPEVMAMDMSRPDLGMGEMTAPLPVPEATVTLRTLALGRTYPLEGVPLSERDNLWPGKEVRVDGKPGRITEISGLAEGRLISVWVEPPGRTVTLAEPTPPALCVPRTAVQGDGVFVIEEVARVRTARRRRVSLGRTDGSYIQVLTGLREGETVVAEAGPGLRDGTIVTAGRWERGVLVPVE